MPEAGTAFSDLLFAAIFSTGLTIPPRPPRTAAGFLFRLCGRGGNPSRRLGGGRGGGGAFGAQQGHLLSQPFHVLAQLGEAGREVEQDKGEGQDDAEQHHGDVVQAHLGREQDQDIREQPEEAEYGSHREPEQGVLLLHLPMADEMHNAQHEPGGAEPEDEPGGPFNGHARPRRDSCG